MKKEKSELNITPNALKFEFNCKKLTGTTLKQVYYEYKVLGFENFRSYGEQNFEYIPLSKLCLQSSNNSYFEFFDSLKFLSREGYYTLDLKIRSELDDYFYDKKMSNDSFWINYIDRTITKVYLHWETLGYIENSNLTDIFPLYIELNFDNNKQLFVLAAEVEKINDHYNFMIPDESLVVFFSKESLNKYVRAENKK